MIIIEKKPKKIKFSDLDRGDVFKRYEEDEDYFMKIEDCGNCFNFITLKDGVFGGYMSDDDTVIKADCKLIVE